MPLEQETLLRQIIDEEMTEQSDSWKEPDIWDARAPAFEARGLLALLGKEGNTVNDIRRLIEVPPEIEASLRAFARLNPQEGFEIEHMLLFREKVAEEFERLLPMAFGPPSENRTFQDLSCSRRSLVLGKWQFPKGGYR